MRDAFIEVRPHIEDQDAVEEQCGAGQATAVAEGTDNPKGDIFQRAFGHREVTADQHVIQIDAGSQARLDTQETSVDDVLGQARRFTTDDDERTGIAKVADQAVKAVLVG